MKAHKTELEKLDYYRGDSTPPLKARRSKVSTSMLLPPYNPCKGSYLLGLGCFSKVFRATFCCNSKDPSAASLLHYYFNSGQQMLGLLTKTAQRIARYSTFDGIIDLPFCLE
jgi:hypothetical protein